MGYQESHIDVDSLAEAAGIIRAIREAEEHEWITVWGAERSTMDLHYGDPFGFNEGRPLEKCLVIPKGTLAVVVCGDRHPYQDSRDMRYIDGFIETDTIGYSKCFERIPQEKLDEAAKLDPEQDRQAYEQMRRYMEHVWDKERPEDARYCRVSTLEQARREREEFERRFPLAGIYF